MPVSPASLRPTLQILLVRMHPIHKPRNRGAQVRRFQYTFQYTRAGTCEGSGPCGCRPGGGGASGSPGDRSRSVATGDDSVNVLRCSQTEHQGNYGDGDSGGCRRDYLKSAPIWPELTTHTPNGSSPCGLSKPPGRWYTVRGKLCLAPRRDASGNSTGLGSGRGASARQRRAPLLPGCGGQARLPGDGAVRGGPRLRRPRQRDLAHDRAPDALTRNTVV